MAFHGQGKNTYLLKKQPNTAGKITRQYRADKEKHAGLYNPVLFSLNLAFNDAGTNPFQIIHAEIIMTQKHICGSDGGHDFNIQGIDNG